MRTGKAFAAGVTGGLVMSLLMGMGRMIMGMQANIEMVEGTMLMDPGPATWWVGFVMHLMISGLIGLVYGWGFERIRRSGAGIGAGFGVVHAVIAGLLMLMMPLIHPRMPDPVPAPGFLMLNLGVMTMFAALLVHVIYGAVVGAIYGPTTQHTGAHRPVATAV